MVNCQMLVICEMGTMKTKKKKERPKASYDKGSEILVQPPLVVLPARIVDFFL